MGPALPSHPPPVAQAEAAVQACRDALASLADPFGIMSEAILAARRSLETSHELEPNPAPPTGRGRVDRRTVPGLHPMFDST